MGALVVLALTSCGGTDTTPETQPGAPPADPPAGATTEGDCDLATAAEIESAYGGDFTVTSSDGFGSRGGGCTHEFAEGESLMVVQAGDRATFELYLEANRGAGLHEVTEVDGIGEEAWVFGEVLLLAVDGDTSLRIQLTAFDVEPLSSGEEALVTLGRLAMGRL